MKTLRKHKTHEKFQKYEQGNIGLQFVDMWCQIEVAQGAIFMEQNIRFGLVLGRLAILKKKIGLIHSGA